MAKKSVKLRPEELAGRLEMLLGAPLRKVTLSRPRSAGGEGAVRAEGRLFQGKSGMILQLERRYQDGKVQHTNLPPDTAALAELLLREFRQINLTAENGSVECKEIGEGQYLWTQSGEFAPKDRIESAPAHNRTKALPFPEGTPQPFLNRLDIMDEQGIVYHRAYDKFRQINRFVQFLTPLLPHFPKDRPLHMYDLCCGKGYLTFAAYAYLIANGYAPHMTGIDLKGDVLARCNQIAMELGFDHLRFETGDIGNLPATTADIVLSLHACDTATDIALYQAVCWKAKAILSSPCCHKDMAKQLQKGPVPTLLRYPILRQRYAEMLTDATRAEVLKLYGYQVTIAEFIPTEHTPKNLLIQAIRSPSAKGDEEGLVDTLLAHGVTSTLWQLLREGKNLR